MLLLLLRLRVVRFGRSVDQDQGRFVCALLARGGAVELSIYLLIIINRPGGELDTQQQQRGAEAVVAVKEFRNSKRSKYT